RRFLRGARETGARRHQAWIGALGGEEISAVLGRDANGWDGVLDRRLAGCRSADRWDRLMYFYAKGFLADQVLQKVDRATMAVGLEGRAPMLATRVVGLATRLDPSLRLRGLTTKYLLKRAMKGLLPDTILGRRKQGFAMPIGPWLRGELRGLLEDTLAERSLREGGLFDAAVVRRWGKEHVDGTADHRKARAPRRAVLGPPGGGGAGGGGAAPRGRGRASPPPPPRGGAVWAAPPPPRPGRKRSRRARSSAAPAARAGRSCAACPASSPARP